MIMDNNFVTRLKDNAIFQMSLSSKELFHSNFLAYLAGNANTRDVFASVLKDCFGMAGWNPNEMDVARERKHFDFSICRKEGKDGQILFVLENKFKSIAYKEQLEKYKEETPDSQHVLLTLARDFLEKEEIAKSGWKIVTYQEYITALRSAASHMGESFDKQVVMHYCDFVETLDQAINDKLTEAANKKETTWAVLDDADFQELRCNDIWQKLLMHQCAQKLTALVKEAFPNKNVKHYDPDTWTKEQEADIFVRVAYYHSQALVEIRHLLPTGVKFCVQQQGNTPLSVGIAIKNSDIKDGIDKQTKKADKKGKWNNALKKRIEDCGLTSIMGIDNGQSYNSFQAADKEGYFYIRKEHTNDTIEGTLKQMIELTKKAIELSSNK